jgi:pilus assembly protein Flp/PilA
MPAEALGYFDMKNFLKTFLRDESGASAAEYALILVIVGIGIVTAGLALSGSISDAMSDAATCIDKGTTTSARFSGRSHLH